MTEYDWFQLRSAEDLHGELLTVAQPRKLFLLGAAFLRRVLDRLPAEAERTAVETTEQFARGRASFRDLLDTWLAAETATGASLWLGPANSLDEHLTWCPDCWEQWQARSLEPGVLEAIRDPSWVVARFAFYARELARDEETPRKTDDGRRSGYREQVAQFDLYRDIIGDPLEKPRAAPAGAADPSLRQLVNVIERQEPIDPMAMLALADALEESGCTERPLLDHCRAIGPHGFGCWAIEVLRGRAGLTLPTGEGAHSSGRRRALLRPASRMKARG